MFHMFCTFSRLIKIKLIILNAISIDVDWCFWLVGTLTETQNWLYEYNSLIILCLFQIQETALSICNNVTASISLSIIVFIFIFIDI